MYNGFVLFRCLEKSWYSALVHDLIPNKTHINPFINYALSMYMASATLTSTGYGDAAPKTQSDRLIASFFMLFGTFLYGYALSSLAATFATRDRMR